MKDQFIKYDTAKLAKEKKFNEPCLRGYKDGQLLFINPHDGEGILSDEHWLTNYEDGETMDNYHTIPTQSLLRKWLREKHEIHIQIEFIPYENVSSPWSFNITVIEEEPRWILRGFEHDRYYKSFEDALEVGLIESLNILE